MEMHYNIMNKKGANFWDYLIWIGLASILGWAFLKSIGVINTAVWVEMIPYYGVGSVGMGIVYKIGKIMKGIETTNEKVDRVLEIEKRFDKVEQTHQLCIEGK